jgi:hypothetical protein
MKPIHYINRMPGTSSQPKLIPVSNGTLALIRKKWERARAKACAVTHEARVIAGDVCVGDYSVVYPESIGPTVAQRVLPKARCCTLDDAAMLARGD